MPLHKQLIESTSELIETRLISSTVSDRMMIPHGLTVVNVMHCCLKYIGLSVVIDLSFVTL